MLENQWIEKPTYINHDEALVPGAMVMLWDYSTCRTDNWAERGVDIYFKLVELQNRVNVLLNERADAVFLNPLVYEMLRHGRKACDGGYLLGLSNNVEVDGFADVTIERDLDASFVYVGFKDEDGKPYYLGKLRLANFFWT